MKFLVTSLVGILALASVHVMAADEGEKKEQLTEKTEEKAEVSSFKQFDPQAYSCKQLLADSADGAGDAEALEIAIVWTHGYVSAIHSTDSVGALDEQAAVDILKELSEYCKENGKANLPRAAIAISAEEE